MLFPPHLLFLYTDAEGETETSSNPAPSSSATSGGAPSNSSSDSSLGWWDMLLTPTTSSLTVFVVSTVFLLVFSGKLRFEGFPAVNANPARRQQQQRRSTSSRSGNSEEDSEDDRRKRNGRKKSTNNNLHDSDSQVADDEDEMTNPEETPFGTPSIANASVLSRRQKKNRKHGAVDALSREADANEGGESSSRPAQVNPENGGYSSSSNNSKTKKKGRRNYAAETYAKLNLSEEQIYSHMLRYVLDQAALSFNSYPLESTEGSNLAYILQQVPDPRETAAARSEELDLLLPELNPNAQVFTPRSVKCRKDEEEEEGREAKESDENTSKISPSPASKQLVCEEENKKLHSSPSSHTLRPTAEEFVPKSCYQQSKDESTGNPLRSGSGVDLLTIEGSGDPAESATTENARASDDEIEFALNKATAGGSGDRFGAPSSQKHESSQIGCDSMGAVADVSIEGRDEDAKECLRCNKTFYVSQDGIYLTQEKCRYHFGKFKKGSYSCCGSSQNEANEAGCTNASLHVWKGLNRHIRKTYIDDCVVTKMPKKVSCGVNAVYALDAEMAFTAFGLELVRISVVGIDGRKVYEAYVTPDNAVIDYNTRFSGIEHRTFTKVATKTLKEVQNDLMGFVNAHTILIGHGLENDLRVLRLVHLNVVDTAILFMDNPPYKPSLRSLVKRYLKRDIQSNHGNGHDSLEDAEACLELMLAKILDDIASQDQ